LLTAVTSEGAGPETLKLLLDHGANANAAMTEGDAPLDWAIYKNDRAKIDILQQHGAKRGTSPRQEEVPAHQKTPTLMGALRLLDRLALDGRLSRFQREDKLHFVPSQCDARTRSRGREEAHRSECGTLEQESR
jgi:ankyrin repeat protein